MKICFKCNTKKPLSEFYKHPMMLDGHLNKCKECNKKDVQKNYRKNIDHYKRYERTRSHLQHRMELRGLKKDSIKYCVIPNDHKASTDISCGQSWDIKNPKKKRAVSIANNAVRDGRSIKKPCVWCGTNKNIQGHHQNYSKPLDVIWLCALHHKAVHHGKIKIYD